MLILALDTSSRPGSIACWHDAAVVCRAGAAEPSTAERLPGEAIALLAERRLSLQDVDVFAVVAGPGSFTGLRVGIACVQGLALASGKLVIPVPTLDALREAAAQAVARGTAPAAAPGAAALMVPCIDGGRGEVFYAVATDAGGGWVVEPAVGTPTTAIAAIEAVHARLGAPRGVKVMGDGAALHRALFEARGYHVIASVPPLATAAVVLASARLSDAVRPHDLSPIYVRRPDVELARERLAKQHTIEKPR